MFSSIKAGSAADSMEMARCLQAAPSEVAQRENFNGLLFQAAESGNVVAAKAALQKGAKVDQWAPCGRTALHIAAANGHADVASELLIAGANPRLETKDALRATPARLAEIQKHPGVLHALAKKELLTNPLRRRYKGPAKVALTIVFNTILAFALTDPSLRWTGWKEAAGEALGSTEFHRRLYLPLSFLSMLLLILLHTKNPGYMSREDAEVAEELWQHHESSPNFVFVSDDQFGWAWPSGGSELFTWCHTCKLWRPKDAAHCTTCRRCCRHFDHHCDVLGSCVGAGNHVAFTSLLLCSSLSWMFGVVSIVANFYYHGAFQTLNNLQVGVSDWPLYLGLPFAAAGVFCASVLLLFGLFHILTLFLNFTTSVVLKGKDRGTWCQPKTTEALEQIFCGPCDFRACGAPEALLRQAQAAGEFQRVHEQDFDGDKDSDCVPPFRHALRRVNTCGPGAESFCRDFHILRIGLGPRLDGLSAARQQVPGALFL